MSNDFNAASYNGTTQLVNVGPYTLLGAGAKTKTDQPNVNKVSTTNEKQKTLACIRPFY